MQITNALLTPGASHGRTGQALAPKGIVVHYVANPGSSAAANRNWFENGAGGAYSSAHYIIGLSGEILQLIPDDECAMHAGRAYGAAWTEQAATNNARYIGIECCHPDSTGKFNDKTMAALLWLLQTLCAKHGLHAARDIHRHYDVTGKNCPAYYVANADAWQALLRGVRSDLVNIVVNGKAETAFARLAGGRYQITFGELWRLIDKEVPLRGVCEAAGFVVGYRDGTVTISG